MYHIAFKKHSLRCGLLAFHIRQMIEMEFSSYLNMSTLYLDMNSLLASLVQRASKSSNSACILSFTGD
jgi:hypothetical protein